MFPVPVQVGKTKTTTLSSSNASAKKSQRTFRTAVLLAVVLGISACVTIQLAAVSILSYMNTAPEVVPYALDYMRTRAVGTPIVLVMNAFQGLCLGQQDTRLPMVVCGVVTGLNVVLDLFLVAVKGQGARGAAVATVVAQGVGLVLMVYLVKRKQHIRGGVDYTEVPEWRGRKREGWGAVRKAYLRIARRFAGMGAVLVARTSAGILAYLAMSTEAMRMGVVVAAAHQIAMQMFWFLSYLPEPLSMAAQVKMAATRRGGSDGVRTRRLLLGLGSSMGIVLAVTFVALTYVAPVFTSEAGIVAQVMALRSLGATAIAVCSLLMVYDGMSIGSDNLVHLPVGVVAGLGVVLVALGNVGGLAGVWVALVGFYATRLAVHLVYYGFRPLGGG